MPNNPRVRGTFESLDDASVRSEYTLTIACDLAVAGIGSVFVLGPLESRQVAPTIDLVQFT